MLLFTAGFICGGITIAIAAVIALMYAFKDFKVY
jgi:hypothetical protein